MSESLGESLEALREAIDRVADGNGFKVEALPETNLADVRSTWPFPAAFAGGSERSELAELKARVAELEPWNQGPFPLGEDLVIGCAARDDLRWRIIDRHVDAQLDGRRVLVVGCGAGYDAFAFATRGAQYVLACDSSDAFRQAEFLESMYQSGVDFRRLKWEALDPLQHGTFDIIHCNNLLHRVLEPVALLQRLRSMTADNGTLLIGSMMLGDPERSEFLRFVPDRHAGDPTWWFIPGRLALRWLVETAGFEVEAELGETEGPRDGFPVTAGYLRARAL
jgi:tRNA (mo5U34)-methyltransferase